MLLHLCQEVHVICIEQEHGANDICQYLLCSAGDARVIE